MRRALAILGLSLLAGLAAAAWITAARPGQLPTDRANPDPQTEPASQPHLRRAGPPEPPAPPAPAQPDPPFTGSAITVAFSPDSRRLATGGSDGVLRTWDPETRRPLAGVRTPAARVRAVAYSPDGKWVLSGDSDGRVRIWDAATLRPDGELAGHAGAVRCLAFTPGGALVSGGVDGTLRLWDLAARRQVRTVQAYDGTVSTLGASGDRLITTGWGGHDPEVEWTSSLHRVRVWDTATGRAVGEYDFRSPHMTLSPDGRYLAGREDVMITVGGGMSIRGHYGLWDASTGRLLTKFSARADSQLTFSPDGRLVAGAGESGYWQLWETATGGLIYAGPGGTLRARAFSPDGRWLACGGDDGRIGVLPIPPEPDRWAREARSADPDRLWADLGGPDAGAAYRAVWTLAAAPDRAVPLLAERMRPPADADPGRVRRLIAELDDTRFPVRDAATKELRGLGDVAEAALREILAGAPSPEVAMRAGPLLAALEPRFPLRGEPLRAVRAVRALELVGTPEARVLLRRWAEQSWDASLAREAKRAVERSGGAGADG